MGFWLPHAVGLKKRTLQTYAFISAPKVDRMPANEKGTKGLGKTLFEAIGFLSFLFGSLILLTIVFGAIGSIFTSTKPLFQLRRVKKDEDNGFSEPESGGR
jgi:hypothetical protein